MSVVYAKFPVANEMLLVEDEVEIPIQINGKVKAKLKLIQTRPMQHCKK